jgi:hypothetical protein
VKITAEEIIALQPCWTNEEVRQAVGKGKTPTEIATFEDASIADRRWVLTRLCARTADGRRELVLWAAGCAQDVRHVIIDEDERDAADLAVAMATAWAEGCATEQECCDAAFAAAYAAYAHTTTNAVSYAASYAASAARAAANADATRVAANAANAASYAAYYAVVIEQHLLDLAVTLENL